jgi:hypothetical protein
MRNVVKRDDSSLGLLIGISAIMLMGYTVGSPNVAPMLPRTMERPFTQLHKELHEFGSRAAQSAIDTWQRAADLVSG